MTNEWQPIETAPRDGRRLMLCAEVRGEDFVFIGGFDPHWSGQCWVSESHRVHSGFVPFAWKPVEPAPKRNAPLLAGKLTEP
jgi:hypothetical protein